MKSLNQGVVEYLTLRENLGFIPEGRDRGVLKQFVTFMKTHRACSITPELAVSFAKAPKEASPAHWSARYTVIRRFAQYWSGFDSNTTIPPEGMVPYYYRRRNPYIYEEKQIETLLSSASQLGPSWDPLRKYTYFTLFGLIAVTGLRLSEPIALDTEDVNLGAGIIKVRQSKSKRSRLVPVHPTVIKQLKHYIEMRKKYCPALKTNAFFVSRSGNRVTRDSVRWAFIQMSKASGLRSSLDTHGPRIHDFRHSFAVRTLIQWYRKGLNVDRHLPLLSTYLGHVHPSDTYWYLTASPELLTLAGKRLENHLGGVL